MVLSGGIAVGIAPGWCPHRGQALLLLPAPGKHLILNKEAQRGQLLILKYLKTKSFFSFFSFFFFSPLPQFLGRRSECSRALCFPRGRGAGGQLASLARQRPWAAARHKQQ